MRINILTLFPHFFNSALDSSILKRAKQTEKVSFNLVNIRDFTTDKHQTTDDRPFGGGPGMVMMIEPIHRALEALQVQKGQPNQLIALTSAKGDLFTQQTANNWSLLDTLTLICGHYEGVDERVALHLVDTEIRIGNYVLTGGEPASLVLIDAVTRLIPGVLGNEASNQDESHTTPNQLGYPQYTRPEIYHGLVTPPVLTSGNHKNITAWREAQKRTIANTAE